MHLARYGRQPEGPTDAERASDHAVLVAQASCLRTPEAYSLTALTVLEIARQVVGGDFKPGFQTPSLAYGADFVLQFAGVARDDLGG